MLVERKVSICKVERETSWAKGPLVNKRKYILQAKSKLFTHRAIISLYCRHTQRSAERDLDAYLKLTSQYIQINTKKTILHRRHQKNKSKNKAPAEKQLLFIPVKCSLSLQTLRLQIMSECPLATVWLQACLCVWRTMWRPPVLQNKPVMQRTRCKDKTCSTRSVAFVGVRLSLCVTY